MNKLTLRECATLIKTVGKDVSVLMVGEPGIGKSAIWSELCTAFPDYQGLYLDATLLDVGDLQMPKMRDNCVEFVPNAMFVADKPLMIMIDELGKATKASRTALTPLFNGEKRIGNYHLHPDSRVFATTNLATDGVGDVIEAHVRNRGCVVHVAKPGAGFGDAGEILEDGWAGWAVNNDIDPVLLAFVKAYPQCLASYTDGGQDDNEFIFHPKKQQTAFVSPRSLAKASHILKHRMAYTPNLLIGALSGTIGEPAARQLQAFVTLGDALPDWSRIVSHPDTCPVPDDPIAQQILALGAVARLDKTNADGWLDYMNRLMPEVSAMFVSAAMKSSKSAVLVVNRKFTEYAVKNSWAY